MTDTGNVMVSKKRIITELPPMLYHDLKYALRIVLKKPEYSVINMISLVVGLTGCLLIMLWVLDEISFDRFHADSSRIFKVMENQTYDNGNIYTYDVTPGPLAEALTTHLAEVELSCRTSWGNYSTLLKHGNKSFFQQGLYADSTFFQVFSFRILEGSKHLPLPDSYSVALSKTVADKYFPKGDAVGNTILVDNKYEVRVTAVFQDIPKNSTLQFDFVLPFAIHAREIAEISDWNSNTIYTYVKLREGAFEVAAEKIGKMVKEHVRESSVDLFLFPMTDWRLRANFEDGKQVEGRLVYVVAFSAIALFILAVACINFINITTAYASNRLKEIGVRKTIGASRSSLVKQFLIEAFLLLVISLCLSVVLIVILLPYLNEITSKEIQTVGNAGFIRILIAVMIIGGTIAGIYPAIFLSSIRPAQIVKGHFKTAHGARTFRGGLVIFQFGVSLTLIVLTLVIHAQIEYISKKNPGFDKNNIIYFSATPGIERSFDSFRNEVLQDPSIRNVARGHTTPFEVNGSADADWDGKADNEMLFQIMLCDYDYIPGFQFTILAGRNFSREHPTDSSSFILTQEAAKRMGFTDPVGQRIRFLNKEGYVIGVIKDFHNTSLHEAIEPMIFSLRTQDLWGVFVRYQPEKTQQAVSSLKKAYNKFEPDYPFDYGFVNKTYDSHYRSESVIGKLSLYFMILSIFIGCMGLLGLALFSIQKRTLELGIRKIHGANTGVIITMLLGDLSKPVAGAILIFSPISFYLASSFLSQYAFRVELTIWSFLLPISLLIVVSLATIFFHTVKAAMRNPIEILNHERP